MTTLQASAAAGTAAPYDALLLVSFGGPERPEDVLPFLRNVTAGRDIPAERLAEVADHYHRLGGRSPINDQCRALLAALREEFVAAGVNLPIYWGNRNWDPYLTDAIATMAADGVTRAACFLTSAYSSYAGCRQYRENLYDAAAAVDPARKVPRLDRLRHYYNHPGFVAPFADATVKATRHVPAESRLVFVTHSIPTAMADTSGPDGGAYQRQHRIVAAEVARKVGEQCGGHTPEWDLAYCSRSGSPHVPWLEPDVNDHLAALAADGVPGVVLVPVGFVSDHMEVRYDLDTEAAATAARLGLPFARAATPGTDARFVSLVRHLLLERAAIERGEDVARCSVADSPPSWDGCPARCCPNPRGSRPALCGYDDQEQPI